MRAFINKVISSTKSIHTPQILFGVAIAGFVVILGGIVPKYYSMAKNELDKKQPSNTRQQDFIISTATPTPPPTPTPTIWPYLTPQPESIAESFPGKLSFVQNGEIWVINADRTGIKQLTDDEYSKAELAISPDNSKILYTYYPREEDQMNWKAYYYGHGRGIGVLDLTTGQTKILVPQTETLLHYARWSPNGKYISYWYGNGRSSVVIDANTGSNIRTIESQRVNSPYERQGTAIMGVSPITWFDDSNKISYIIDSDLVVDTLFNSNPTVLDTRADAYHQVFESTNDPKQPVWSLNERYVAYYKDYNLYFMDSKTGGKTFVVGKEDDQLHNGKISQGYLLGFGSTSELLYYYSNGKIVTIRTEDASPVPNTYDSGITSAFYPQKDLLATFSSLDDTDEHLLNVGDISKQNGCRTSFDFRDNDTGPRYHVNYYPTDNTVWSSDGKYMAGITWINAPKPHYKIGVIDRLSCEFYEIHNSDNIISSLHWFY